MKKETVREMKHLYFLSFFFFWSDHLFPCAPVCGEKKSWFMHSSRIVRRFLSQIARLDIIIMLVWSWRDYGDWARKKQRVLQGHGHVCLLCQAVSFLRNRKCNTNCVCVCVVYVSLNGPVIFHVYFFFHVKVASSHSLKDRRGRKKKAWLLFFFFSTSSLVCEVHTRVG